MALQGVEPIRPEAAIRTEPRVDLDKRRGIELVPPLLRLLTDAHEAGVTQHAQMLGHAGLAHPEHVDQFAHGAVAVTEQIEDPAPSGLGDDVKCNRHAGMIAN
jgi:hypothetical protein